MDALLAWLITPISGSDEHALAAAWQWHARFMVLAWGVMIPLGILIARYFKVTRHQDWPRQLDNQQWWRAHLALQIGGTVLSFVALGFALNGVWHGTGLPSTLHVVLGWAILTLAAGQVLGGAMRGTKGHHDVMLAPDLTAEDGASGRSVAKRVGDHFVMSVRRCVFEYVHKVSGYLALGLSMVNILIGLGISDAPRWMWIVILGYWFTLGAAAVWLQRSGRCVDTYQAIYGPDDSLPGNLRAPIGWGVHRYRADEWPPNRGRS